MTSYKKSALIFLTIVILFEIFVAVVGQIHTREAWGDEVRLVETVVEFGNDFSMELLRSYKQLSTPLPFIIYGLWGKLFGFALFPLRILSIIIALITYLLFHRILWQTVENKQLVLMGTIFLMVHPYNVGLSIFVFTDMPAILFMLVGIWGLYNKNSLAITVGIALSILCRQYMLFLVPPLLLYYFLLWHRGQTKNAGKLLLASLGSLVPYLLLVWYWGGTSPDNQWRAFYLTEGFFFKTNILYLYLMLIPVYLFPYFICRFKEIYNDKKILIISVLLSPLYFLTPITPSKYSVAIDVHTVGVFHRGLKYLTSNDYVIQTVFYLCFLLTLPFLLKLLYEVYIKFRARIHDRTLLLNLIILSFLFVMPFSYLGWEKYFMPILPILILKMSLPNKTGDAC